MSRWWWFPENVSQHGVQVDNLNFFIHVFMLILFVGWGAFFVYCLLRFRRREGVAAEYEPIHAKGAKALEIGVVLIEAALLILISVPVWSTIKTGFNEIDKKNAVLVRVIGEQFAWNFHYAGPDGVFGKTEIKKIDAGNPIGLDRSDAYAKDDIVAREMRLPVNRDVIAYLSSKDVIHSFGVHELRVKHDLIPGLEIPIWFHVTKTSEELRQSGAEMVPVAKAARLPSYVAMQDYAAGLTKGSAVTEDLVAALQQAGVQEVMLGRRDPIEISCSQLCGLGHYKMKGIITVETEEQYAQWLASRAPKPPAAPAAPVEQPAAPAPAEGTDPAPAPAEGTAPAAAPAEGTAPAAGEQPAPAPQTTPTQP